MAAFPGDLAAIASSGEILSLFRSVTNGKEKEVVQPGVNGTSDVADRLMELKSINWGEIDINTPHKRFNIINNELRAHAWKVFLLDAGAASSTADSYNTLCQVSLSVLLNKYCWLI